MTVSTLRLLGVRPRERGEPGAQLRVGLGGPAPGQRAPRAVEQQSPSEPVVSGQQRGAPPRLERDLAGRSDVRYADVSQHFVEPLDGFLNRSTVHPRPRGADESRGGPAQLTTSCMLLAGFIVSRSRARGGRLAHGGQARRTKDGATLTFPEIPRRPLRRYGKRRRVWKRRLGRRTTRATHPGAQPAPSRRSSPGAPRRGSTSRAPPSTPGRSSFCPGSRHRGIGIPTQRRYSHPRSRKAARLTPGGAYQPLAA